MENDELAAKRASDPAYDQLYKMWAAAIESLADRDKEVNALNEVVKGQIRSNDSLGELEGQRHLIMAEQLVAHNTEVQTMGEEINRLRQKLAALGIDPDAEEE